MDIAIIGILIAALAAIVPIIGWFVVSYLQHREQDRERKIEREDEAQELIRKVLTLCNRQALYTRMHGQVDPDAMFSSLASCRIDLQKILYHIEPMENQELVTDVINKLLVIEKNKKDFKIIDQAKLDIIDSLVKLSERAKVSYFLPHSITEEAFDDIEGANKPLVGPESPTKSI